MKMISILEIDGRLKVRWQHGLNSSAALIERKWCRIRLSPSTSHQHAPYEMRSKLQLKKERQVVL